MNRTCRARVPPYCGFEKITSCRTTYCHRSDYDSVGYAGSKFSLNNTPLDAINSDSENGSLTLAREGDTFVFDGTVNFTPDSDEAPRKDVDTSNIEVAISFPGTVTAHNGELDSTRLTWNTSY